MRRKQDAASVASARVPDCASRRVMTHGARWADADCSAEIGFQSDVLLLARALLASAKLMEFDSRDLLHAFRPWLAQATLSGQTISLRLWHCNRLRLVATLRNF